uniref:Uncharacterized protein n=1 Tax=Chromera velia CCMP2878 TaxID=1169474 RepID=A0A0K6S9Z1_9ALVE|eukprot:Cvel_8262.t2-p1 / transcript=Cvel_8262.t2 / gene=Cvel_8262 / organism=Chromera_velia_CCMP2878 / gene_product=hypothetical protein / transcript_product=hypothetical protein / location=Cvel_scaffold452:56798-63550(+) / protein_length=355 / sequence_SO=supercontig / SO=protein_coding / is_pseudo=false
MDANLLTKLTITSKVLQKVSGDANFNLLSPAEKDKKLMHLCANLLNKNIEFSGQQVALFLLRNMHGYEGYNLDSDCYKTDSYPVINVKNFMYYLDTERQQWAAAPDTYQPIASHPRLFESPPQNGNTTERQSPYHPVIDRQDLANVAQPFYGDKYSCAMGRAIENRGYELTWNVHCPSAQDIKQTNLIRALRLLPNEFKPAIDTTYVRDPTLNHIVPSNLSERGVHLMIDLDAETGMIDTALENLAISPFGNGREKFYDLTPLPTCHVYNKSCVLWKRTDTWIFFECPGTVSNRTLTNDTHLTDPCPLEGLTVNLTTYLTMINAIKYVRVTDVSSITQTVFNSIAVVNEIDWDAQ